MSDGYPTGLPDARPGHSHDPPDPGWLELKFLLVGGEQKRLTRVEERLDNSELRADEIGRLLPGAIARGAERNPLGLAEALLLVIGPAIRNAVSTALQEMIRNLDRLLNNSLSPTAWRWRLEALRTGKPFSEIVLLHSLQYRVEQIFLVHRRTSLVMRHLQAPSARGKDPDQVSAMLSAIQDFVRHSFGSADTADLHVVQAGDLTIWVEQGPLAFLAAAIRGSPPLELRAQLRAALDQIHIAYYRELQDFQGDTAPFESLTEPLESCLVFQLRPEGARKKPVFALGFCAILCGLWIMTLLLLVRETRRWNEYVKELRSAPGVVVTSATGGVWIHSIAGFRDPIGADPEQILRRSPVDPKRVRADWRNYVSAAPELVLLRAKQRLHPPDGVSFTYEGGALRAFGLAPKRWIVGASKESTAIPGIDWFDARGLETLELRHLERQKRTVEAIVFLFATGSAGPDAEQQATAQHAIEELVSAADAADQALTIQVVGHADKDGGEQENLALSAERARAVIAPLRSQILKPGLFTVVSAGSTRPVRKGGAEADKAYNRSVTFEVTWKDRPADQD